MSNNIKWVSKVNQDWVHVIPSGNTYDNSPRITIDNNVKGEAIITFTQLDSGYESVVKIVADTTPKYSYRELDWVEYITGEGYIKNGKSKTINVSNGETYNNGFGFFDENDNIEEGGNAINGVDYKIISGDDWFNTEWIKTYDDRVPLGYIEISIPFGIDITNKTAVLQVYGRSYNDEYYSSESLTLVIEGPKNGDYTPYEDFSVMIELINSPSIPKSAIFITETDVKRTEVQSNYVALPSVSMRYDDTKDAVISYYRIDTINGEYVYSRNGKTTKPGSRYKIWALFYGLTLVYIGDFIMPKDESTIEFDCTNVDFTNGGHR